ncbi:MAG: DoxX family protein [Pseudomonadota bacterium]
MKFLDNFVEQIYALFRIVTGFLFLWHGSVKLFDFPMDYPRELTALTAAAGAIEFVLGALVMLGLFSRYAAFISSGTMAVAYWMVHHSMDNILPIGNGGTLAALYCFAFLYIAAKGPGIWSINDK